METTTYQGQSYENDCRSFFRNRMNRQLGLRASSPDPIDRDMLDRAIYSTYRDLQALGVEWHFSGSFSGAGRGSENDSV